MGNPTSTHSRSQDSKWNEQYQITIENYSIEKRERANGEHRPYTTLCSLLCVSNCVCVCVQVRSRMRSKKQRTKERNNRSWHSRLRASEPMCKRGKKPVHTTRQEKKTKDRITRKKIIHINNEHSTPI